MGKSWSISVVLVEAKPACCKPPAGVDMRISSSEIRDIGTSGPWLTRVSSLQKGGPEVRCILDDRSWSTNAAGHEPGQTRYFPISRLVRSTPYFRESSCLPVRLLFDGPALGLRVRWSQMGTGDFSQQI